MTRYSMAILALITTADVGAQTSFCYPVRADSLHQNYMVGIRAYSSNPDSSWTAAGVALGFPRVAASAITLVTSESTCQIAAQAFAANVPTQAFSPLSDKVYVFAVGPTHYFVVDPDHRVSPNFSYHLLFTSSWTLVQRLGH